VLNLFLFVYVLITVGTKNCQDFILLFEKYHNLLKRLLHDKCKLYFNSQYEYILKTRLRNYGSSYGKDIAYYTDHIYVICFL